MVGVGGYELLVYALSMLRFCCLCVVGFRKMNALGMIKFI